MNSVDAKLQRAEEHVKSVEDKIHAWSNSGPYEIASQFNDERTVIRHVMTVVNEPSLIDWSLIVGDAVHNMRSALDHLVYGIARRESRSKRNPPSHRLLEFPICDTDDRFAERSGRLRWLSDDVRARIENAQPYKRRHADMPPMLSAVRDLDDADKHHLLRVVLAFPDHGEFEDLIGPEEGSVADVRFHVGAVVHGTEVLRITFDRPTPQVSYKLNLSLVIGLGYAWGPLGYQRYELMNLLGSMMSETRAVVAHLRGEPLPPITHASPLPGEPS